MTDEEVDNQYTVLAVMLATPFLNGDHGDLPTDVSNEIQATLWGYGYIPAEKILLEEGATLEQVKRARFAKMSMFNIVDPEDRDVSR